MVEIASLLPHKPPMLLLTELKHIEQGCIEVYVDHLVPSVFANTHGQTPAWVGLEYMAQAISAYGGYEMLRRGKEIQLGFLLGARSYRAYTPFFDMGQLVCIKAQQTYRSDDNIVQFRCTIHSIEGQLLAESDVKAVQPDDPEALLGVISNK